MCILLISLVNNDFQINKCTIILHTDEGICYALLILNITYLSYAISRYKIQDSLFQANCP